MGQTRYRRREWVVFCGSLVALCLALPHQIATLNGATFLGIADRAGSIEIGKQADLLVVKGIWLAKSLTFEVCKRFTARAKASTG